MLSSPPPSSKDVFSLSLSPRLPGRGTLPFVSKGSLSLSLSLSLILSFAHSRGTKREGEGEESFTWTRRATGRTRLQKSRENREGGRKRKDEITRQEKGDASVFLCSHVLCTFPLAAV